MGGCHFIFGSDQGKQQSLVEGIHKDLVRRLGEEPEILKRQADQDSLEGILDSLGTGSLFHAHLMMVVTRAESFQAAAVKALQKFWEKPPAASTLVLVSDDYKTRDKFKFARKEELHVFFEADDQEKTSWIQAYVHRAGGKIGSEALEALVDMVDADTLEMRKTCDMLLSLHPDKTISSVDVEEYVFHSREENVYTLFETVLNLELEKSLEVLHTMIQSQTADPVQVVSGLQWQLRSFLMLKDQCGNGPADKNTLMRLNIRRPPTQKLYQAALRRWKTEDIERRVRILADMDMAVRQARPGSHVLLLELMLYQMIQNPGARFMDGGHPGIFDTDWIA